MRSNYKVYVNKSLTKEFSRLIFNLGIRNGMGMTVYTDEDYSFNINSEQAEKIDQFFKQNDRSNSSYIVQESINLKSGQTVLDEQGTEWLTEEGDAIKLV